MKLTQTKFGAKTSNGKRLTYGNCLVTCIACILEIPIEEVPNIQVFYGQDKSKPILEPDWLKVLNIWLKRRGLAMIIEHDLSHVRFFNVHTQYVIVRGNSPRNTRHCCIAELDLSIKWDPHPSREGLDSIDHYYVLTELK